MEINVTKSFLNWKSLYTCKLVQYSEVMKSHDICYYKLGVRLAIVNRDLIANIMLKDSGKKERCE